MAVTGRFIMAADEELKTDMKIQQTRSGDSSVAEYIRRLVREDKDKEHMTIKNSDIYNKLVDIDISLAEIKEKIVNDE